MLCAVLRFPVASRSARDRVAAVTLAAFTAGSPILAGFHEAPNIPQVIGTVSALLLAGLVAARPEASAVKKNDASVTCTSQITDVVAVRSAKKSRSSWSKLGYSLDVKKNLACVA
jgi:hypothetical protein